MVDKFDEFLEEVKKDIRQEKFLNLWKRYGKSAVGGVIGILMLTVGYNLWGHYEHNKRVAMAEKLMSAQDYVIQGNTDKALAFLDDLSASSYATYQSLALFQKAGILRKESKPLEAIAIYKELSENSKLESIWRDLASLLMAITSMDQPNIKEEELINRLNALISDNNPWQYFAREIKGTLLYRKGEKDQAAELFARLIQDNQTPPGISMRAKLMAQIVSTALN